MKAMQNIRNIAPLNQTRNKYVSLEDDVVFM